MSGSNRNSSANGENGMGNNTNANFELFHVEQPAEQTPN